MYANWGNIMAQREHVKDIQREVAMNQLADQALGREPRRRSRNRPPLPAIAYAFLIFTHAIARVLHA